MEFDTEKKKIKETLANTLITENMFNKLLILSPPKTLRVLKANSRVGWPNNFLNVLELLSP